MHAIVNTTLHTMYGSRTLCQRGYKEPVYTDKNNGIRFLGVHVFIKLAIPAASNILQTLYEAFLHKMIWYKTRQKVIEVYWPLPIYDMAERLFASCKNCNIYMFGLVELMPSLG